MNNSNLILEEINKLKEQQKELRQQLCEVQMMERKKNREMRDVSRHIKNGEKLAYIYPSFDQVCSNERNIYGMRRYLGKVAMRTHKGSCPDFDKIRNLAKTISNYTEFSLREDNFVDYRKKSVKISDLSEQELELVIECADEIIDVLYKYKVMYNSRFANENLDFVLAGKENKSCTYQNFGAE